MGVFTRALLVVEVENCRDRMERFLAAITALALCSEVEIQIMVYGTENEETDKISLTFDWHRTSFHTESVEGKT